MTAARRHVPVCVVLPPRTLLLDVAGPLEVLRRANLTQQDVCFDVHYVGATRSLRTSIGIDVSGIDVLPRTLAADTMVVIGGNVDHFIDGTGVQPGDADDETRIVDWLRATI